MDMSSTNGLDLATFMNSMKDSDGFNGNGSWWWILLLFFLFGGNGFGWNNRNNGNTATDVAVGEAVEKAIAQARAGELSDQVIVDAVKGNGTAIAQIANVLQVNQSEVRAAIANIENSISQVGNQLGMSSQQIINAIQAGNTTVQNAMSSCCCELKQLVTNFGYENRIQNMQQTEQLGGQMNAGFLTIGQKIDAQTLQMNAGFQDLKNYLTTDKIATMQAEINDLKNTNTINAALNPLEAQLNALTNRVAPAPIPAYTVNSPYATWYGGTSCSCNNS